jgi:hypothetical protein
VQRSNALPVSNESQTARPKLRLLNTTAASVIDPADSAAAAFVAGVVADAATAAINASLLSRKLSEAAGDLMGVLRSASGASSRSSSSSSYPQAQVVSRVPLLLYSPPVTSNLLSNSTMAGTFDIAAVPSAPLVGAATGTVQQQQQQQQELVQGLFVALDQHYSSDHDLSWGLGSLAALAVLDADWGLDCLTQRLDWCNGKMLRCC